MTGRNDPCPCGSGKKYKKCCGQIEQTGRPDALAMHRAVAYRGQVGQRREAFCRTYISAKETVIRKIEQSLQNQAEAVSQAISCHKGCDECCKLFVAASLQECEAIVYYLYQHEDALRYFLRSGEVWRERIASIAECFNAINNLYGKNILSRATAEESQAFHAAMDAYQGHDIPCPFLVDGACSIYAVRPYVCAGVVSLSPAEWCRLSHPDHQRMVYIKTEMPLEQDLPYFTRPRSGLFFASMPLLVYDILHQGYAALSTIPGLEALQSEAMADPEVLAVLRHNR